VTHPTNGPPENWIATLWLAIWMLFFLVCILSFARMANAQVPPEAVKYQRLLTREARALAGLDAPVAMFAGQIEQESAWRPRASSAFAQGLAEFTPATAAWISGVYPKELGGADVYNPEWAVRALVLYDTRLYHETQADADCDHWAKALSAYNGGVGWVLRDEKLCDAAFGCDQALWFGNVERYTARSKAAAVENRGYPRRILLRNQYHYATWGVTVSCPRSQPSAP